MKNAPGYPLPSGELGSDDIVCQLVYLPDRAEYWQAFYAALHYMTTWRAWERDEDKRGKDAAKNWREAFELTSECWRMTCLEQLQDDVAEILAIMQLGNQCCDDIDVTDGDQYTDRVEDGEGDVPQNIIDAGYADDAADWDGFDDYKCMIANVIVDQMPARLLEFAPIVNSYGAVAGGAAAVAAILAVVFGTGGLAIVFGLIAGVGAVSLLYESLLEGDLLVILAAKVVTNKDELVCSVYDSDGDIGAFVALNDKIDELFTTIEAVILKNMNLGPTLKALYAGRYDQQDIAEILFDAGYELGDFSCNCLEPYELSGTYDFHDEGDDAGDWHVVNGSSDFLTDALRMFPGASGIQCRLGHSGSELDTERFESVGSPGYKLKAITFDVYWYDNWGPGTPWVNGDYIRLRVREQDETGIAVWQQNWEDDPPVDEWQNIFLSGPDDLGAAYNVPLHYSGSAPYAIQFEGINQAVWGANGYLIDNIVLYVDEA